MNSPSGVLWVTTQAVRLFTPGPIAHTLYLLSRGADPWPPRTSEVVGVMKEYRLASWPQLRAPFDRIAYRRMLSDMSHRHMSLARLVESSGVRRQEVSAFIEMLGARGLIAEREVATPDSLFGSLRPLGDWLRRALSAAHINR